MNSITDKAGKMSLTSRRSKTGSLVLLLGLVLIMGSSTSASNALSSNSFTTSNGKTFTKHDGFGHFQSKNGKANGETEPKNGKANGHSNGHANGHAANGVNGNGVKKANGVNPAFLPRNGKKKPDPIVAAEYIAETKLPTDVGQFKLRAYRVKDVTGANGELGEPEPYENTNALEPVVIYSAEKPPFGEDGRLAENVPVRIHDQCLTSEVFRSQRCDCKEQLKMALEYIQEHGGAVIYLQQEGRGIGLANKVAAYELQDMGMDTVDANLHLGFPEDCRKYGVVPTILKDMGIGSIQLMTNNPRKVERLNALGIKIKDTVPILANANPHNRKYLETKQERMNHSNFDLILTGDPLATNKAMMPRRANGEPANGSTDPAIAAAVNAVEVSLVLEEPEVMEDDNAQLGVQANEDGYCFGRQSVEDAIAAVARGEMIVVVDDMDRENEGDFIMAADLCTPLDMAKIVRYSSGVICVGMEGKRMDELKLPAMVSNSEDPKETAFSVSVDATPAHGITTGISAGDRSKTVQLLANSDAVATDFNRPGHLFPLRAREGGVLTRDGHTEAAVDFSRLAGRAPCGVLCEIVSEENPEEMMRLPEIKRFCRRHGYVLTSIADLAQYRKDTQQ